MRYYAKMYLTDYGKPYALGKRVVLGWKPEDGDRDGCRRGEMIALAEVEEEWEGRGFWVVPGSRNLREPMYRIHREYKILRIWRLGNKGRWREVSLLAGYEREGE